MKKWKVTLTCTVITTGWIMLQWQLRQKTNFSAKKGDFTCRLNSQFIFTELVFQNEYKDF